MGTQKKISTLSAEETQNIGKSLLGDFPEHNLILLYGNLGSGKTTFTKGLAKALGIESEKVKSPTYAFYNKYSGQERDLYHFDLYKLNQNAHHAELMLELEEIVDDESTIVVIEWASRLPEISLPHLKIDFIQSNLQSRTLVFTDHG